MIAEIVRAVAAEQAAAAAAKRGDYVLGARATSRFREALMPGLPPVLEPATAVAFRAWITRLANGTGGDDFPRRVVYHLGDVATDRQVTASGLNEAEAQRVDALAFAAWTAAGRVLAGEPRSRETHPEPVVALTQQRLGGVGDGFAYIATYLGR